MAEFVTISLMLLLFELEITVLNCNQFSPLVILINDYSFSCYNFSSVSESRTTFSGLPHVTDPQPHDGIICTTDVIFICICIILWYRFCKCIAATPYKPKGQVLTAKASVSIDCNTLIVLNRD